MTIDAEELEAWLRDQQSDLPDSFEQQVMAAIHREPPPAGAAVPAGGRLTVHWQRWLTGGALAAAGAAGLTQFITFLFAIWTASAAG
jgi:hypothetical protein